MKLFVKNKILSFGGSSFVLDENNKQVFTVKGKLFTFTSKKNIYDEDKNLKFVVRNKFWKFIHTSAFIFDEYGNKVARISNNDFDFTNKFKLRDCPDEIEITGSFLHFSIIKNGKEIGTIDRQFTIVRDAFVVDVFDPAEAAFLVAITIALDNIRDKQRSQH